MKITAIIIDDEENNRNVLRTLLNRYCTAIDIVDEAANSDEAFNKIELYKPKLIFLDIMMPKENGFNLLKRFPVINFEVIFVTAYDKYAIRAFDFNAIGYILKPITIQKLIRSVEHAIQRIRSEGSDQSILHFVKNISEHDALVTRFTLHHRGKVVFVEVSDISFIEAKETGTTLVLADNMHYFSTKDLITYEEIFERSGNFIRISRNVLLNMNFIKSYTKGELCTIELKSGHVFDVARRRKGEILKKLKEAKQSFFWPGS